MSWRGALLGLGAALVMIGGVLAMGTMKSQKNLYRDTMMGNYGMAGLLVIIGSVLIGAMAV